MATFTEVVMILALNSIYRSCRILDSFRIRMFEQFLQVRNPIGTQRIRTDTTRSIANQCRFVIQSADP